MIDNIKYKLVLPKYILIGKKKIKKIYLNKNIERNLHWAVYNKIKAEYANYIKNTIKDIYHYDKISISYFIPYNETKDLDNLSTIHYKFLQDALVKLKIIDDDSMNHIIFISSQPHNDDKIVAIIH